MNPIGKALINTPTTIDLLDVGNASETMTTDCARTLPTPMPIMIRMSTTSGSVVVKLMASILDVASNTLTKYARRRPNLSDIHPSAKAPNAQPRRNDDPPYEPT
jgi:hypothetical protein